MYEVETSVWLGGAADVHEGVGSKLDRPAHLTLICSMSHAMLVDPYILPVE